METNNLTYEVKNYSEEEWSDLLDLFDDANIYQTRAFAKHSLGGKKLEYCIIKKDNSIIAISIIRLITIPVLDKGIAYIRWGPLWKRKNKQIDFNNLSSALKILYKEYVRKRKLVLKINTNLYTSVRDVAVPIFTSNGFHLLNNGGNDNTVLVNIAPSLEDIRMSFHHKWRYNLKKSGKENLELIRGKDTELFDIFLQLYKTMHSKKQFEELIDVSSFKDIQNQLVEKHKMNIFICKSDNKPVAALVGSALGDTGIYLLGASNNDGRNKHAGYFLQMEMIKWLKNINRIWYDLCGIDEQKNPGVYFFKTKMGKEISYIGTFEAGNNFISKSIVWFGNMIKGIK